MKLPSVLLATTLLALANANAEEALIAHEWGTFTSLQDESGQAISGINTDDEPVPQFVHRLADLLLLRPSDIPGIFCQGAPSCHPDVTMRLETPVIYFHSPESHTNIYRADIHVRFRGGWLTEFYPDAKADAPGLTNTRSRFPHLGSTTESTLSWNDLQIGGSWPLEPCTNNVWTSPRAVHAQSVRTGTGENEKFLFYRGVAHIDAPLKISRDLDSGDLVFRSQLEELPATNALILHSVWLVDIHPDGGIAFRTLPALTLDAGSNKILARTPATFDSGDYHQDNFGRLKTSLQKLLVSDGLYPDEALALLNTWELSYFKSPGLRVFFIVPRAWTDFYLPLDISPAAQLNRVMVGRIELVTPEQRSDLKKLAGFPPDKISSDAEQFHVDFMKQIDPINKQWDQLMSGKKRLSTFISLPKSYQAYLDLGRFRNALLLDEAKRRPAPSLDAFITAYHLQAYSPAPAQP